MTQKEYDALKKRSCQKDEEAGLSASASFRLRLLLALFLLICYGGPGQRLLDETARETICQYLEKTAEKEQWIDYFEQFFPL